MADRVAVFNDGKIVQSARRRRSTSGRKSRFVADFVGSSNVLPPDFVQRARRPSSAGPACGPKKSSSHRPMRAAGSLRRRDWRRRQQSSISAPSARSSSTADSELTLVRTMPATALPAEGESGALTFQPRRMHLMEARA